MKNLITLLLVLFIISCTNEYDIDNMSKKNESTIEKFVGLEVGHLDKDEVKVTIEEESLLNSFNAFAKKNQLNKYALSFKVLKIDDKFFLRFYNQDKSSSTIELISNEGYSKSSNTLKMSFEIGETVCTSAACASCCGCVPDGDYCTECTKGGCSRTTSG
jgi:hypothetical protein